MTEPLRVRWDRTVIHSTGPGDDTIVCCLDQHGHPVALFLDDDLREALGLALLDPDGVMDQADDEAEQQRAAHFREAADLLEVQVEAMRAQDRFKDGHPDTRGPGFVGAISLLREYAAPTA